MPKDILVREEEKNKRLDKFLTQIFPHHSRSFLQKNIKEGWIKINGRKTAPHHFLKPGEKIEINLKIPEKLEVVPDQKNKPEIIFQNNDFLIVNKPAGLLVHPAEGKSHNTLAGRIIAFFPKIKEVGDDFLRPGIVHRLDKEASGLMVIAKNQKTFQHLKEEFKNHRVKKEYLALVKGKIEKEEGIIDFSIARSKEGKMVARPKKEGGKTALTEYKLIKKIKNYSLLKVRTLTGRTHQIRLHLRALGFPIVGDKLYKSKKDKEKIKLERLFLHAALLGFYDQNGQWHEFQAPLPEELEKTLKTLES